MPNNNPLGTYRVVAPMTILVKDGDTFVSKKIKEDAEIVAFAENITYIEFFVANGSLVRTDVAQNEVKVVK